MDTYQGTCRYCGEIQPIMAENQEEADNLVTGKCLCGAAKLEERKMLLMARINYIASARYSDAFSPLPEDQTKMIRRGGQDVLQGNCEAVMFSLTDSKIKIWNAGDKIKVKRTASREETAEA